MGSSPLSDLAIAGSNNRGRMDNRAMNLFRSGTRNRITSTPVITAPLRCSSFLCMRVAVALALSGLSVTGRGQLPPPPPDGGYPGNNTAEGANALFSNPIGTDNTATGVNALFSNSTGSNNTATGDDALSINATGMENTATGVHALSRNSIGSNNTATGVLALSNNTTASNNTATGSSALSNNTTGIDNTATGLMRSLTIRWAAATRPLAFRH